MDLEETGLEDTDWTTMVYDRVQWWGLVNVVQNLFLRSIIITYIGET